MMFINVTSLTDPDETLWINTKHIVAVRSDAPDEAVIWLSGGLEAVYVTESVAEVLELMRRAI